jgi:hypothetical protein
MEITGGVAITMGLAVIAGFVTQAIKQRVPQQYHRFIPLPLAAVLVGVGVALAWLQGQNLAEGGLQGFFSAALAVYGYEFFEAFSPRVRSG